MVKENLLKLNDHDYIIVNSSVASIYNYPNFSAELITQAVFWEKLLIKDRKDNWYKIKQRDGYEGWIHSFYIINSSIYDNNEFLQNENNWYWVVRRFLKLSKDNQTNLLISYGSLIPCIKMDNDFFTILPNGKKVPVDKKALIKYSDNINYRDIILNTINELIGIPYLWGGKSSFGFDCSGLMQTIFNVSNIKFFPRDASQQVSSNIIVEKKGKPSIGDIIFFKSDNSINHVGLYINNIDFVHSSGCVKINSIDKESSYYSSKLKLNLYGIYEINTQC